MFAKGLFSFAAVVVIAVAAVVFSAGDSQRATISIIHKALTLKAYFSDNPRGLAADCRALEAFMRMGQEPPSVKTDAEEIASTRKLVEGLEAFFPVSNCEVTETSANGVKAFWVTPKKNGAEERKKVVVYLHGGGYAGGSITSYRHFVCELATATNSAGFFVEYSLAPETPHPGGVQEAVTAIQWLTSEGKVDGSNIVIAGDSTGGGMSLLATQKLIQLKSALPKAVVVMSPWTDLTCQGKSLEQNAEFDLMCHPVKVRNQARIILGENAANAAAPEYSPLYGSFAGFPSLYIAVSKVEGLYDDSIAVAKKAKAEGVQVTLSETAYLQHVAPFLRHLCSESDAEFGKIAQFIRAQLHL